MSHPLQAQLDQLQEQCQAQQEKNKQLQTALDEQKILMAQSLAQRTLERQQEAKEQKKAETLQRVFYRIAERSTAGLSFYDFLKAVHELLEELLYAKNFYVCLRKPNGTHVDFPYYVDEKDGDTMQCNDVPNCRNMSDFVMRSNASQLIDSPRLRALQISGDVTEATGDLTFNTWLGVPMQMHGVVSGMLAVQAYEAGVPPYTEEDAHILGFVANHVSAAIERYQAIDEVRQSEARYRSVVENVGVGVGVAHDGYLVFVNPCMVDIIGRTREFLLQNPFTAAIHPDDAPMVIARHDRRLRGETLDPAYTFRVITQTGEVRTLEISVVPIQWGHHDAALLFVVDITSRLEAERHRQQALQQQTALNDMKARFITMASHEFRTPLATIHSSVELLQHYEDRMPAGKKTSMLQKIDDAVGRMTHMLENVLVIGRTDAGHLEFSPHAVCITAFCRSLADETWSAMARRAPQIQLHLDLPPADHYYWLDDSLIRNIVGNLLSNAIKYSPYGGEVDLSVQEHDGQLVFTVSDQGIGIPETDHAQLFSSFHRASNVGTIAGTGLGLSIVKEAVLCHQGSITVTSQEGQGSRFTVCLPAPRCNAEDSAS